MDLVVDVGEVEIQLWFKGVEHKDCTRVLELQPLLYTIPQFSEAH